MTRSHSAVAILLLLAAQDALRAQESQASPRLVTGSRPPYRIVLDFLGGKVEVRTPNDRLTQSWSAEMRAAGRPPLAGIPSGSPIEVEVVNANPLLYRYDLQAAVVARRPVPSCATLGARLITTGFLTSFATIATATQPMLGPAMGQLFQVPASASESVTRGDALVTTSAAEAALAAHGAGVERYIRFLSTVRSLAASLEDSVAVIAELGESQPTDSLLAGLVRSLDGAYPGLGQSARVPRTIRTYQEEVRPHLAALSSLASGIERGNYEGDPAVGPATTLVRLMAAAEAAQANLSTTYRALQALLLRIENARLRARQVFSIEASSDIRRLTLDVQPTAEYPAVFRSRLGRQEIFTEPTVSLLCQVSIGVSFMDHPPSWTLGAGGALTNSTVDQRSGVSVLLHVASPRVPALGGLLGFGFGTAGAPDLYAGGSIRILDPLMLNAGVVWQRSPYLPAGFVEGEVPPDAGRLSNLPQRYAATAFWGLSIAR